MKIVKFLAVTFLLVFGIVLGLYFPWKPEKMHKVNEILTTPLSTTSKKNIIGFLPFWLIGNAKDSYKEYLTTLAYYALVINSDGTIQKRVNPIEEEPGWTTFKMNKMQDRLHQAKNDGLDTSLLIFTVNEDDITQLVSHPEESASNFLGDIIPIMQQNGFTDLNMDIESFVKTTEENQEGYATFLELVKKGLDDNNAGTLTIDITPESLIKPRLTKIELLAPIADYIILMAYDYHYIYSPLAGPVGPIGGGGITREYDVETAIQIALQTIHPRKLILGIPLYGYEWETIESIPGSPIIPDSGKTASTRRISEILSSCENCILGTEDEAQQPYIIIPEDNYYRQIFYEDESSMSKKIDLAKKYKLGGIALWALGYEDQTILNPLKLYK